MNKVQKVILLVFCLVTTCNLYLFGSSSEQSKQKDKQIEAVLSESFEYYQSGLNHKAYDKSIEAYHWLDSNTSK